MKDHFALESVGHDVQFLYLCMLYFHKLHKLQAWLYFGVIFYAHQIELANQIRDNVMVMWPLLVSH